MNIDPVVVAKNLTHVISGKAIIDNVSLNVYEGEVLTIVGINGSGKTTLIKILSSILKPHFGSIQYIVPTVVGYVPQKLNIDPVFPLSVADFLALNHGKIKYKSLLGLIDISPLLNKPLNILSGGELQKVLIFNSLINRPKLLILDEPTSNMDVYTCNKFYELLNNVNQRYKCSIVIVSHDLSLVMKQTNRVICMNHHICCEGRPCDIQNHAEFQRLFQTKDSQMANISYYQHHHREKEDQT